MTWTDPDLITPAEVEDLAVEVLRTRHPEHLAAHERRRGLAPETLERLRTVSHYAALDAALSGDALPAALVGSPGTFEPPTRNEENTLDVSLTLGVDVTVVGKARRDTLRRRDWTAWTVAECLLQRLPRSGVVSGVMLRDVEAVEDAQAQRIRGVARLLFTVTVPGAVSLLGLPADDDVRFAPGGPGGPPPDGLPYDVPVPLGEVDDAAVEVIREEVG